MGEITIDTNAAKTWKKRWDKLQAERFQNDYETARLADEIRAEFPDGTAGDLQFCLWCKANLKTGSRTRALLMRAEAFRAFSLADWERYGGWPGVSFLLALPALSRKRLLKALDETGAKYTYGVIRMRAMKLGITSRRKGRDNRTQAEAKIQTLRAFIVQLYKKRHDLPPIPAEVKTAITPTVLSALTQAHA